MKRQTFNLCNLQERGFSELQLQNLFRDFDQSQAKYIHQSLH